MEEDNHPMISKNRVLVCVALITLSASPVSAHSGGSSYEVKQENVTIDIGYDPAKRILYVPTFNGKMIVAYKLVSTMAGKANAQQ